MKRPLFAALGLAATGLGFVGYVVPGMPSTVFFLIALWAFRRSSERLENWLLNLKGVGPTLRDWDEHRAIARRTKRVIYPLLWASILASSALLILRNPSPVRTAIGLSLPLIAVAVTWYVATRPEGPATTSAPPG